jgi:hypothetical protein
MKSSPKKRVRFGELRVREFERAPLGEHPLAKGGFAMTLGPRYGDWAPIAIPDGPLQQRYHFYIKPEWRKELWKVLLQFEQELLEPDPDLGVIAYGGKTRSIDEQRWFEKEGRHQAPMLEQSMDEQRAFEYQKPFARLLEQRQQKCQNELEWNRRKARLVQQWRSEQALLHSRMEEHQRKRDKELEWNRHQQLAIEQDLLQASELDPPARKRSRQEQLDNCSGGGVAVVEPAKKAKSSYLSSDATWDVVLFIALELAFVSVLMLGFLIVPFVLDILFGLSICKDYFATPSWNGFTRQYRQTLSFCMEYCSAADCCIFVLVCFCVFCVFM